LGISATFCARQFWCSCTHSAAGRFLTPFAFVSDSGVTRSETRQRILLCRATLAALCFHVQVTLAVCAFCYAPLSTAPSPKLSLFNSYREGVPHCRCNGVVSVRREGRFYRIRLNSTLRATAPFSSFASIGPGVAVPQSVRAHKHCKRIRQMRQIFQRTPQGRQADGKLSINF
jgi:hypothetical protein